MACWYQNRPQDAQKGRPARPQRAKWRIVLLPYGEPLSDARTPLADFFRILLVAGLSVSVPAVAHPPTKQRLPLTLLGAGCESREASLNAVLQGIPGVVGVYFNRVPEHVLVDITPGAVMPADVVNLVNAAAASWSCTVEIMQSCITGTPPPKSAAPHPHD